MLFPFSLLGPIFGGYLSDPENLLHGLIEKIPYLKKVPFSVPLACCGLLCIICLLMVLVWVYETLPLEERQKQEALNQDMKVSVGCDCHIARHVGNSPQTRPRRQSDCGGTRDAGDEGEQLHRHVQGSRNRPLRRPLRFLSFCFVIYRRGGSLPDHLRHIATDLALQQRSRWRFRIRQEGSRVDCQLRLSDADGHAYSIITHDHL